MSNLRWSTVDDRGILGLVYKQLQVARNARTCDLMRVHLETLSSYLYEYLESAHSDGDATATASLQQPSADAQSDGSRAAKLAAWERGAGYETSDPSAYWEA